MAVSCVLWNPHQGLTPEGHLEEVLGVVGGNGIYPLTHLTAGVAGEGPGQFPVAVHEPDRLASERDAVSPHHGLPMKLFHAAPAAAQSWHEFLRP